MQRELHQAEPSRPRRDARASQPVLPSAQWAGLLLLAAAVRALYAFVWIGDMAPVGDSLRFVVEAQRVAEQGPFAQAYYFPAGLIWLLASVYALAGADLWVTRTVTLSLSTLTVPCVVLLTRELTGEGETGRRAALLAGGIAALYPPSILFSAHPIGQSVAYPSLILGAYLAVTAWRRQSLGRAVLAGGAVGALCLARSSAPSVALALLGLGALLVLRRGDPSGGRARAAAVVVAGGVVCVAVVSPVLAHHARLGEGWTLSTANEWNLFVGNNPYTPHYLTGHLASSRLSEHPPEVGAYLEAFKYGENGGREAMRSEALTFMVQHPWLTLLRGLNRARAFWGFDHVAATLIQSHYGLGWLGLGALLLLEAGGYAVVMLMALVGCTAGRTRIDRRVAGTLLLVAGSYQAPFLIAHAHPTYHFPVMPLIMPLAAVGALALADMPPRRWPATFARRDLAWALCVFVAIQVEYGAFALMYRS